MTTTAPKIRYKADYDRLVRACQLLIEENTDQAKAHIEPLVLDHVSVETDNGALLGHIASTALMRRIDRKLMASKNIYLQDFDVPQIVLFYKMLEAYPQVAASHRVANWFVQRSLSRVVEQGARRLTLLDIGVGKGKQAAGVLQQASEAGLALEHVDVVGLDPDPTNVEDSGQVLSDLSQDLPFDVDYHPMCRLLEDLTTEDYRSISDLGGALFINSAFTMHHVAHAVGDRDRRTDYFRRLRELEPVLVTLVEPNSDHDEERISRRLHNCWVHFATAFDLIDRSAIDPEHKFLVKRKFFGREIENILGVSDHLRSERHEPMESWLLRLTKAGFEPVSCDGLAVDMPDYCETTMAGGVVGLGYDSMPLVCVFAFQPAD